MNPVRDMQNFAAPLPEAALALAQAACDLDWNKSGFPPHLRIQAISLARDMHKLADALEEQIPPSPPLQRGESGAGEDLSAGPGWAAVTGGLT